MNILSICGSPRKGNSEAIINKVSQILSGKGIENEIILLREKNIGRCLGCVEYCNKELKCHLKDDFPEVAEKFEKADGYVFVCPNYFNMPPGIFKDFMDRTSIFYTAGKQSQFKNSKAVVICVGAEDASLTEVEAKIIADNYCGLMEFSVVGTLGLKGRSELNGNYDNIFENGFNPNLERELESLVERLLN